MPLQRVLVDFGADESFERASKKLKEHYNLDIPKSTVRKNTLYHAQKISSNKKEIQKFSTKQPIVDCIIAQADGTMTPIVVIDKNGDGDQRKNKKLIWREARLSLAYKKGTVQPVYDASFGSTDEVGDQIAYCVESAGQNKHSKIHFVGDGAPWIAEQVERMFGNDADYLIDYYHMTQYLAEAAQCCSPSTKEAWRRSAQSLMKEGKISSVLKMLKSHMDDPAKDSHECTAAKCYNYMIKRLNQFDYKGAISQGLPIGSGRVESAHRAVIQKRLKVPGAWWSEENAGSMLAMRVIRENGFWDNYWRQYANGN